MADKRTVLIVDDEIVSRSMLEALLESEDYTLVFAESGVQGLEKAASIIPDLIILDVMMPGMNGFEVCRRLRASEHLKNIPLVMVTAWNDPVARSRCLELGANEVICKPFNHAKLHEQIAAFF